MEQNIFSNESAQVFLKSYITKGGRLLNFWNVSIWVFKIGSLKNFFSFFWNFEICLKYGQLTSFLEDSWQISTKLSP